MLGEVHKPQMTRLTDAVGVRGCDTDRQAQKSDNINGRMAQLVEPTGQVIKLPVHEYLK